MRAVRGVLQLAAGTVLGGRFEVREQLASDGLGERVAALDKKTGRTVSLRCPRDPALSPPLRGLAKELGALEVPNVVGVFGTTQLDDGQQLLVEGPVTGRTVDAYVAARNAAGRPVSLQSALNIASFVARALEGHKLGPHGGLRPGAVWITDAGAVQLADYALTRAAAARGALASMLAAEQAFLAPEVRGGQAPTVQSDVYGVAAVLYLLATGSAPAEPLVPASQLARGVPREFDAVFARALADKPSDRPATPFELLRALGVPTAGLTDNKAGESGLDIDVEVSMQSTRPSALSAQALRDNALRDSAPRAGSRVSVEEEFRISHVEDISELEAARERRSLGEVQLKDVLSKISEDDAPRWMLVKNGMDHGPFSGRQVVNMIVQGGALRDHELLNTDTGRRDKISAFAEFNDFLAQYELERERQQRAEALEQSKLSEKRGALFKVGVGIGAVVVLGLAVGVYALTRGAGEGLARGGSEASDLYKRGALEISGSAGILPMPRGGARRAAGAPGGGAGLSYEDAMMQAVDIGSAASGGEGTLTANTVAGVMNRHLGGIFGTCVKGSVGQVVVDIAIAGSGQVMGVSVRAGDAGFQRCVAEQVRHARFPSFASPRMGARYSFGT